MFYYTFHIKSHFFKTLFQSQFLYDFDEIFTILILCIIFVPAEFSFFYRDDQLLEADLRGIQEEMSMNNFVL
jgi:hypothetical protein